MRVITGRPLSLRHTFLDADEETPLTVTGPVEVELRDVSGETVATATATDPEPDNEWAVTIPAQPMGQYWAHWNSGDFVDAVPVEVVGGFLFTVPQARNSDEFLKDVAAFPASEIVDYREVVESEFQNVTYRSFTPRVIYRDYVSDGTGEFVSLIPDAQEVEAVWVNGEAVADASTWVVNSLGKITTTDDVPEGDAVRARVRYGFTEVPSNVRRVGMVYLRHLMAAENSGIPDRATTWQPEEGGTFRLATAGVGPWETGIPEVDAVLKRYRLDTVLAVYAGG